MKKKMLLALLVLTGAFQMSFAASDPYVDYLYNDTNYPIIGGRQGVGRYVDLTSIHIIKNDQFGVEFTVNVLSVDHNKAGWENHEPKIWTFHYFKNFSEPNSLCYLGTRRNDYSPISWDQINLTDRVGAMEVVNHTFVKCMEQITGKPYQF